MAWLTRMTNVFRRGKLERELEKELAFHVNERMEELIAGGMPEAEARRAALARFGNYTLQKETTRDMDIMGWLESVAVDLNYGLRQLRLNPGFAAVAILTLALGVGANMAIFQVIDAIRLRSLPVKRPTELAMLDRAPDFFTAGSYRARNPAFTYAQYQALKEHSRAFSGVLAFGTDRFKLNEGGEARYAEALDVSPNFLDLLGVVPIMGRDFGAAEERSDCGGGAAIVSYSFWKRELGADPRAIGRTIRLDGRATPVIGVTPPDFFGLEPERRFDVAVPLCENNLDAKDGKGLMFRRDAWWLTMVGRLRPGWTVEAAKNEVRAVSPAIFRETVPETYPAELAKSYLKNRFTLVSASAGISPLMRQYGDPLWILLGTAALVLLIACANLANLLLARASAREREIAVRQALGASSSRVVGQMLTESLLLAVAGVAAGALLAQVLSRTLVSFLTTGGQPLALNLGVDFRVFAFAAGLALLTCLLFGLAPALRASGFAPAAAMRAGGRGMTGNREHNRLRRSLVVVQVALSLVLLAGAILFGRSMHKLLDAPTGMKSAGVLLADVDLSQLNDNGARRDLLLQQLRERIAAEPDVAAAGTVLFAPFSGNGWNDRVQSGGVTGGTWKTSWFNAASRGFFPTTGTRLIAGRDFDAHDDQVAPHVAIVDRHFVKEFFGGRNPVGRTFRTESFKGEPDRVYQIVGEVENTKYAGLREEVRSIAWVPLAQTAQPPDSVSLVIRARGPLSPVIAGVKQALAAVSPNVSVEFSVLDDQIQNSVLRERLMANLSGGFGLLAAILSALGIYGVMSYMVARRRNEIGVRLALGAGRGRVVALVLREAGWLLLVGVAAGLGGALLLGRYAESLLYSLKANDPPTLLIAAVLLSAVGLLATLAPARRAANLEPLTALREE